MTRIARRSRGRTTAAIGAAVFVVAAMAGMAAGTAHAAEATAPDPVTTLVATTTETGTSLSWVDPTTPGVVGIMIRRAVGATAPAGPADGTLVATLAATATGYDDVGLVPQTAYSYTVFTFDAQPAYSGTSVHAATAAMSWRASGEVDAFLGRPSAVSCPTTTFCMSVDTSGQAIVSVNGTWRPALRLTVADEFDGPDAVSCASASFCAAVTLSGTAFVYRSGVWSSAATLTSAGGVLIDVSCASKSFCLAVGGRRVYRWNGTSWSAMAAQPTSTHNVDHVSCSSASFCMAVSSSHLAWHWNGSHWTSAVDIGGAGFNGVSCHGTFCMVAEDSGYYARYSSGRWATTHDVYGLSTGFDGDSVSCTSSTFCVVTGSLVGLTDVVVGSARFNGSSWSTPITADAHWQRGYVSCALAACVMVDDFGVSRHGDGLHWGATAIYDPARGNLVGVSCASATYCMATDGWANFLVYRGLSWSAPRKISNPVAAVAAPDCVTTTFCLTVDSVGHTWVYDGSRWTRRSSVALSHAYVSCSRTATCVAASDGKVSIYNGTTWSMPRLLDPGAQTWSVSCAHSLCAVVDLAGAAGRPDHLEVLSKGVWHRYTAGTGDQTGAATCADPSFCILGVGNGTDVYQHSALHVLSVGSGYGAIACLSDRFCVASQYANQIDTFNGSTFGAAVVDSGIPVAEQLMNLSCVAPTSCAAVGRFSASIGS